MTQEQIKAEIEFCKWALNFAEQSKNTAYSNQEEWDQSIAEWKIQIEYWEQKLIEVE